MPRTARTAPAAVAVREAGPADLDALLALHDELDSVQTSLVRRGRNVPDPRGREATRAGLAAAVADPVCYVALACDGSDPVGFALVSLVPTSALVCDPAARIDPVVVARRARRRGVGRALLAAAAAYADEHGATVLTVAVRPTDRDGNRYFARLGFVPAETRRVAPVAAFRRSLGGPRADPVISLDGAARRRRLRSREVLPPSHGEAL